MNPPVANALILLLLIYTIGSIVVEIRSRNRPSGNPGRERRKTRKITELEPLGEQILRETQAMIERDRLATRDGLKFIIKMMQELYIADIRRTIKVNELVEQFNVLEAKSVISWIEKQPKLALFISLLLLALMLPEIRQPIFEYTLRQIGVGLP